MRVGRDKLVFIVGGYCQHFGMHDCNIEWHRCWSVLIPSPTQLAKLETQSLRDSETVGNLTMELREFTESNASSSKEIEKLRAVVRVCARGQQQRGGVA